MQRYFSTEKKENQFLLNKDDCYHITRVMRMKTGEEIEVVHEHQVYLCHVCIEENGVLAKIKTKLEVRESVIPAVTLVIPLLKEQKMDLILQKATELGVHTIIPVMMERSIVKANGKEEKKIERWQKICKEAAEQSMRTTIPNILEIKKLKDLESETGLKLICSTKEKKNSIKMVLQNNLKCDKLVIVVGPEGGLSEKEEELLVEIGFTKITLGERIMRVETVPLFLLSSLNYEFME